MFKFGPKAEVAILAVTLVPRCPCTLENARISVESTAPLTAHELRLNDAARPVGPLKVVAH